MSKVNYQYHHIGIPTEEPKPEEKYSATFKMYSTLGNNEFHIQWHRFEKDSPLHPLLKSVPHVAFKVNNLDEAIKGKKVLLAPYCPFDNFRVAVVEIDKVPVEFIETSLTEDEIWGGSRKVL